MKFFNITDTMAFLEKVRSCSGNVYCVDSNGVMRDLKLAAEQLVQNSWLSRPQRLDEINVVAEQAIDSQRLYRYMMEIHSGVGA